MLSSSVDLWTMFGITFVATVTAVYITDVRRLPRFFRMLARNALVLTLLLFAYQVVCTRYGVHPLLFLAVPSSVSSPALSVRVPAAATGDSIVGGPSLSASFVDRVLVRVGSPAAGTGQVLYDLSIKYHVDDAYALSTFQHESTYGMYGAGAANHSLGNIICAGYPACNGRFRWYNTWAEGYEDFYRLIAREYVARGCRTLACIIPVYAPPSENNTAEYVQTIRNQIVAFRSGSLS